MSTLILHQQRKQVSFMQKLSSAMNQIQIWSDRYHQRKQLAQLEQHSLEDIGVDGEQVAWEISKPFWKK